MSTPDRLPIKALLTALAGPALVASLAGAQTTGADFRLLATATRHPAPGVPTPFDTLLELNPQTGAQSLAGPEGGAIGVNQMDGDPAAHILVGTNVSRSGIIYQIDPATGVASIVANIGVPVSAIAFAPDGTLFGAEGASGAVLGTIDLDTQTFSPVMTLDRGAVVLAMDFSPAGLLYAIYTEVASSRQSLVVLDVIAHSVVSRANLGTYAVGDIDYAPDGFIYHTNFSYALIRIDPANPIQTLVGFGQVGAAGALASVEVGTPTLTVQIDVKPGSVTNPINPCSSGVLPIAVLSTSSFDARTVDPNTVMVGTAHVRLTGRDGIATSPEDVDGDGDLDLVVHVLTTELGLRQADVTLTLTGTTFDGRPIKGTDSIAIVPRSRRAGRPAAMSCRP
jgi:hypothetical protein